MTESGVVMILNFNNDNLSLIEISHRSKPFVDVMEKARKLALELLGLENKGYQALYLQGGASLQFLMVAYNLLEKKNIFQHRVTVLKSRRKKKGEEEEEEE